MIDPALRDKLTTVYSSWLDQDDFGQRYAQVCSPELDAGVSSVRQLLAVLLQTSSGPNARIERPAGLDHPDSTFLQLLGSPLLTQAGPRGLVEAVVHHARCLQAIPRILFEAFGNQGQIDHDGQPRGQVDPTRPEALAAGLLAAPGGAGLLARQAWPGF